MVGRGSQDGSAAGWVLRRNGQDSSGGAILPPGAYPEDKLRALRNLLERYAERFRGPSDPESEIEVFFPVR